MLAVTLSFFFSIPLPLGLATVNDWISNGAASAVADRGEDMTSCTLVRTEIGSSAEEEEEEVEEVEVEVEVVVEEEEEEVEELQVVIVFAV